MSSAPKDVEAQKSSPGGPNRTSVNPKNPPKRKISIAEEADIQSTGRFMPPAAVRCFIETPFRVRNPTTKESVSEATAWAMDAAARGPLNQAGSFIGAAVLRSATKESILNGTGRVYGLRPGSLLTMASVITGLICAVTMPLVGAIVDHTRYRKHVGLVTALVVCVITGVQTTISEETWFPILLLEVVGGFSLIAHMTASMAYLPDLSEYEDELAHYTSRFNITQYCFQICYVGFITAIGYGIKANTVKTAQLAAGTACGLSTIYLGYAWMFLFRKREALSKVPEGENLVNTGFKQIFKTARLIFSKYRALKWFMIALLWSPEAGAGVVLSIAVTFLTVEIKLTGIQIGVINITLLMGTIPGSAFSKWIMTKLNPLVSFRISLFYMACCVGLTSGVLTGPERKNWSYLMAFLWGLAYGWVYPCQRVMQCTLIPKGQNNEIMGFFSFCAQILGWLPALLFSIMVEKGVSMRWGMSLVAVFLLLAIFFTYFIGNYDAAVAQVAREDELAEPVEMNGDNFLDESSGKDDEAGVEVAPAESAR
mmetsp:Transcript_20010/g.57935  ORF Transcript_20010/g.57935 Transcript_20010/m.57935 type:complete len:539 (-) Transcript_20010:529-2145(-)|eukprot:CAMPEP_0113547550 /NCGR_PEP_ID=MMETSP0015_2-20120614/12419_1 /TAXON_ID=2838 /ORGANISM="Odontella" /LENGTH=538 /DNA_ID=CAMNT_0000448119 /DNA_START=262 /DNA_END=1878 /DNA_ORIENTATION=+ /assembly_acc=CAM_ASM_000160